MLLNFIRKSGIFFVFKLISGFSWLISLYFLTRILSPENFGLFFLINTSVLISINLSYSWLSTSILRYYPEQNSQNEFDTFNFTVILLSVISSLILSVILAVLNFQWMYLDQHIFYLSLLYFNLQGFNSITTSKLRAKQKILSFSILNTWLNVGGVITGILLTIRFDNGLIGILTGLIFANLIPFIIYTYRNYKIIKINVMLFDFHLLKSFYKFGSPLILLNIFSQGLSNLDKYLVNYYLGDKINGLYTAIYSVAEQSIFLIISVFTTISTPIIYNIWISKNKVELNGYLQGVLKIYLIITIFIVAFLSLEKDKIACVLLDDKFQIYFYMIPFISISAGILGIATIYTDIFTAALQTKKLMYCYLFACLINLILNLILIPKLGVDGAVYATALSYISMLIAVFNGSRKIYKWTINVKEIKKLLLSSFFISALMFTCTVLTKDWDLVFALIFDLMISTIIYFIILKKMRLLTFPKDTIA
jgi:O-antigen/teichoic acid export membrane protein